MEPELDIHDISKKYEMAGGAITNVARYCSLMALKRGSVTILKKDLLKGIRKEFAKEGKTVA
jgi:ATP-dependent 26S proteasome regulatory subunit